MNKKYIKWEDVEKYVDEIVGKYKGENLSGVYGIPRGGLVIAVIISYRLGIPLLTAPTKGCLIVDDICDSGESLLHYQKNSSSITKPVFHITTMVYKDNDLVMPEYYMMKKKNDWIVFPWEDTECIE